MEWIGRACIGKDWSGLVLCSDTTEWSGLDRSGRECTGMDWFFALTQWSG